MDRLKRLAKYPELWILSIGALVTRLWQVGLPPSIVFDELYFRQFAANYLDGHYFFDIHPPLIKLLFAGIGSLAGFSPGEVAESTDATILLRIFPAIAGALLVPLIYIIIRQFGLGRRVATLGAVLVLLDNALLVESRFILMDSLLLIAGFGALSCYLALRRTAGWKRWIWVVVLAVSLGTLITTKWSGLAVATLIACGWLYDAVQEHKEWRRSLGEALLTLGIVMAIYIGSFAVHFSLLTHSGEGDAFMSEKFQATLVDNPAYSTDAKMSLWDKITELNTQMYTAQSSLNDVQHPYASRWYTWPLEIRPVYYWQGEATEDDIQGNIYLLGNPIVWWMSAIGLLSALIIWLIRPQLLGRKRKLVSFLLIGYALNFVPFAFIDRPMFLYHYLFALVFAILITATLCGLLFDWQKQKYGKRAVSQTFWVIVVAVLLGFLYFMPLSYGWPMTSAELQLRMWLPSWR